MDIQIFVINICDHRWKKYDPKYYTRWKGVNGKDLNMEWIKENYIAYWNCNENLRRSVAGCSESHLSLLKHIYENNIEKCIIIEDDALIDFEKLSELEDMNDFCYVGGRFQTLILKNNKNINSIVKRDLLKSNEINMIDTNEYIITGGHGYYIPNPQVAEEVYKNIMQKKKRRAIDCEYKRLQKEGKIKYFIFPAIATLHLPDSNNGFTFNKKSNWTLKDNNYLY